MLTPAYFGSTDSYTLLNATRRREAVGRQGHGEPQGHEPPEREIQQHVFGDILKRSVTPEVRVRLLAAARARQYGERASMRRRSSGRRAG